MSSSRLSALAYNLYLKHDVLRVAQAFHDHGLTWLLIKGAALAESAYGGIAERPMVDTDIVVLPGQVSAAHRILLDLGFHDRPGNDLELNLAADFEHPMHFPHRDVETGLELHWHIYAPELFRGGVEPYFHRAVTRTVLGLPLLTLDNQDRLVQLAAHWAQHGLDKPAVLRDIALLWNLRTSEEHFVQEDVLLQRLQEVGALHVFSLALCTLEHHGRLVSRVPAVYRTRRAELFHRAFGASLAVDVDPSSCLFDSAPEETTHQQRLRLLSWALLLPDRIWLSARREVWPSRARLQRIAGRSLTPTEATVHLLRRQMRGIQRILAREPSSRQ